MGVAILLAFAVYLALLLLVVRWAVHRARATGKSPLLWGGAAAAAIVLPVFWDWIPTILVHEYYCETKTFARVYKTAEQWKAEHPADAVKITPAKSVFEDADGIARTRLNSRFVLDREDSPTALLPIRIGTYRIVDLQTGEVMVEANQVGAGYGSISVGGTDWRVFKFWLSRPSCGQGIGGLGQELARFAQLDGRRE
jgi:hypothetical protein